MANSNSIITVKSREKLAKARNGLIALPKVAEIGIGDGGIDAEGKVRTPNENDVSLRNLLLKRAYDSTTQISATAYRYRIDLRAELVGKSVSELALFDYEGDMLAVKTFKNKTIETDMEISFEIDDIF